MRRLFVVAATLVLASCSPPSNPGAAPGTPGTPSGDVGGGVGDGGVCARPEEGCACDPGSAPMTCYADPTVDGGQMVCHEGRRYCRGGTWTACETVRTFTLGPVHGTSALIDGPTECNPCDPACSVSHDYPTDMDLTPANSSGIEYDPGSGGVQLVPTMGGTGGGTLTDTDGDGVPDVADDCVGPGWQAPCDGSATDDGFYETLPYGGPAVIDPFAFMVQVRTADVYFLMDTTGSMGGEIANLQSGLTSGTFIPGCPGGVIGAIQCTIPDAWFGVGYHDDYPLYPYGVPGIDHVYHNVMNVTNSLSATQSAVNSLVLHNGYDLPEGQSQALWAIATGNGLGPYLAPSPGCSGANWGYPCFRPGTIPIVILFTDAQYHNGPDTANDYSFGGSSLPPPTTTTAVSGNEAEATAYDAGDVTSRWVAFTGGTCSMSDDYTNVGCNGAYSPDAVFKFTVSTTKAITISLGGSSYDTVLSIYNSSFSPVTCNDDASGIAPASSVTTTLSPGTYYAVVDGYGYSVTRRRRTTYYYSCGSYQITIGDPSVGSSSSPGYPVTWAQAVAALNAHGVKTIEVNSDGSSTGGPHNDAVALCNATGSVNSSGAPSVIDISSNGTGLSTAVVNAVQDLANYSRMDVSAVALDNPATTTIDETGFVQAITAVSFPAGRCTGISGNVFLQCLPGTNVNFNVTFNNNFVMPTTVPQVFDFTINVMGNGTYLLQSVPVRIVVPPAVPSFPASGTYSRDYDATIRCSIPPDRPDWQSFTWTANTPSDSSIDFQIRTADTIAGLGSATPVAVTVPSATSPIDIGTTLVAAGQANFHPYLRVTAVLNASTDRTVTPTLTGFELQYTCTPME